MVTAKDQHVVGHQRQVRRNDELDRFTDSFGAAFRRLDDSLDQREIEERLAALEFDIE
jgi:hypothetical protein